MSYEKKNRRFVAKPVYEGGEKALQQFIQEQIKYPEVEAGERLSGIVEIKIDINSKGRVMGGTVTKSLGKPFDKEAKRVASLLRFSVPGTGSRSGKMIFHRPIKIRFTPPSVVKQKRAGSINSLSYSITSQSKKETTKADNSAVKKPSKSYGYTINIG